MTLNELDWLAKFLVSKQIDSAAYVHTFSAQFVEVLQIVFFSNTASDLWTRAVWNGFKKPRFLGFLKKPKKPKKSEFRFFRFLKKNKNLMSDFSYFSSFIYHFQIKQVSTLYK